jgi:predicted small lipoprotein YifL
MIASRFAIRSAAGVALVLALTLAGCGKKGSPQPPPGVPNTYPQPYPRD